MTIKKRRNRNSRKRNKEKTIAKKIEIKQTQREIAKMRERLKINRRITR